MCLCRNRHGEPTTWSEKAFTCGLLFPLYIIIAWAACVYTFLHQDKEKEFVDISRFIFEAIGLIAIALASLFLPYAVNHLD